MSVYILFQKDNTISSWARAGYLKSTRQLSRWANGCGQDFSQLRDEQLATHLGNYHIHMGRCFLFRYCGNPHHADDPLYTPAVRQVRASLGQRGLLYVGDCKMAALETRAFLHAGHDFYLCPLSALQVPADLLDTSLAPVWTGEQAVTPIYRYRTPGHPEQIAEGYEVQEPLTAVVAGETCTWTERRLVIRSLAQAQAGEAALHARLAQAQTALASLTTRRQGKPRCTELTTVREAAEAILARYRVQGLLRLHDEAHVDERPVRRYGARPATVRVEREVQVIAEVDQDAVTAAVQRLGGRVYATNHHPAYLTLTQAG